METRQAANLAQTLRVNLKQQKALNKGKTKCGSCISQFSKNWGKQFSIVMPFQQMCWLKHEEVKLFAREVIEFGSRDGYLDLPVQSCPLEQNHWTVLWGWNALHFHGYSGSPCAIKCHWFKWHHSKCCQPRNCFLIVVFFSCTCTCKYEWHYFHLTSSCDIVGIVR